MRLQSMSVEVITLILDRLSLKDMLACKLVCRFLSRIIDASDYLQYKIELAAAGMVDGPPGGPTTAERRTMLTKYQKAWREVEFSPRPSLTIPSSDDGNTSDIIFGDILALVKPTSLEFVQLPSRVKRRAEKRWSIDTTALGFQVNKFAVDPSQDLLVVVDDEDMESEPPIHLLSLTSGEPHPLAALAVLQSAEPVNNTRVQELRVHGDAVGWMVFAVEDEGDMSSVQLWNWKTGALVWQLRLEFPEPYPLAFAFLDAAHVVLTYYTHISVFAFDLAVPAPHTTPRPRLALDLPPGVDAGDDGGVQSVLLEPFACAPARTTPFACAPDAPLLLVTVTVRSDTDRMARFVLFVPARTLRAPPQPRSVPWAAWGPAGARGVEVPYDDAWGEHGAAGARGVLATWAAGALCVRVLEFAPLLLRREMLELPAGEKAARARVAYVTEPWTVSAEDCFEEDVATRLACRESRWLVPRAEGEIKEVMPYEDGIVLKKWGGDLEVYAI